MTPTNKLIERLADACDDDDVGNLWPILDEALGLDPDTATFEDTASALRSLLPTRDPRVDPRAWDVLRWRGRDGPVVAVLHHGPGTSVRMTLVGHPVLKGYAVAGSKWAEFLDGMPNVQVLYVAPEVDHAQR